MDGRSMSRMWNGRSDEGGCVVIGDRRGGGMKVKRNPDSLRDREEGWRRMAAAIFVQEGRGRTAGRAGGPWLSHELDKRAIHGPIAIGPDGNSPMPSHPSNIIFVNFPVWE